MTVEELKRYAAARYEAGYDVVVECYDELLWEWLATLPDAEALAHMAAAVNDWRMQMNEVRYE